MSVPACDLAAWRGRIPLLDHAIPLANCSHAPPTVATLAAAERYLTGWTTRGMDWDGWIGEVEGARAAFARLIGAEPEHVAVTTSVSQAVSSLVSAWDFSGARRRVLVSDAEFPTVGHVWLAQASRGAEIVHLPAARSEESEESIAPWADAIDERTLCVSTATAWYQNGARQDVAAIAALARRHGAFSFVDAYQTLGTEPTHVGALGVDFLASGCLKYLLGVPGLAFLYVRPELVDRLHPAVTGWFGRANPFAFDLRTLDWAPDARRFDTGTPPVLPAFICRAGLEQVLEVDAAAIRGWLNHLGALLARGGTERGLTLDGPSAPADRSPVTAFRCADAANVEARLRAEGMIASARGPVIRLAPHFFTTEDDCHRALDLLASLMQADR